MNITTMTKAQWISPFPYMYMYIVILYPSYVSTEGSRIFEDFIEFSLEQSKGGVQFVVPPGTTPDVR